MDNWQEWLVALILLFCLWRIVLGVRTFFWKASGKTNPCDKCISPCDLKRLFDEKQRNCGEKHKKSHKSCCG